jgi:hypothetical protein
LQQFPFDPYDFFGYLAAGFLVILGMDLVLGFPHVIGQDLKVLDLTALLLAVYVAGQLVATPAKALLEDLIVDRVLERPNVNLFRSRRRGLRRILFPGFYKPFPESIRSRILAKAEGENVKGLGEGLFLHVRYHPQILSNEKLIAKLGSFIDKYGFARNLAFTSFIVGLALLVKFKITRNPELIRYGLTAVTAAVLLFYRYLKFFRQYSYEMFNTYAGLRETP